MPHLFEVRDLSFSVLLVILQAFRFTSAHHSTALQAAMRFSNYRVLAFKVMVAIEINHDPVSSVPKLVCTRRIGVKRGEMPVIMSRV